MNKLAELSPVTSALAAACALALLLLLTVLLPTTLFSRDKASAGESKARPPQISVAAALPFESYKTIFEKPLFNPGHHADPAPVMEQAKAALPALSDYRLVGIMLMGGTKLALVERRSSKQVITVRPGDEIDGRHVDGIVEGGVRLSGGAVPELLEMPRIGGFSRNGSKDVAAEKNP